MSHCGLQELAELTLPQSHDFNYNEAVNFCLPDWLQEDLECVLKYRELSKPPVFSHDELLVTIFNHEKNPKASRWLLPLFEEMVNRELAQRSRAREGIASLTDVVVDEDHPDEYYQCKSDKSYCYLSQITARGVGFVTCVDHHDVLGNGAKIMKIRFTDDELKAMLARVKQRASSRAPEKGAASEVELEPSRKVCAKACILTMLF